MAHSKAFLVVLFVLAGCETDVRSPAPQAADTAPPAGTTATATEPVAGDSTSALATYENERFGFSVAYPDSILTTTDRSQNGDGAVLSSETGAITLRVSASHNASGKTLREIKRTARADFSTVVSEEGRQVYSVLRGTGKDGNRLIKRIALRDGDLFKLELSYPEERALSATLVDRILTSFDATPTDELTGMLVQIAVLDYAAGKGAFEKESDGKRRGCDRVTFVDRNVAPTEQPLTAALEELFAIEEFNVEGWQNFIAKTNETLSFDRATIDDGIASIYLLGKLSGLIGTCDDPRARIQIEETALQFPEVDSVAIYLNDQPTDLQPDARG